MTKSLDNGLLEDKNTKSWFGYRCRSILRYIKILFRSQKVEILKVLEVSC